MPCGRGCAWVRVGVLHAFYVEFQRDRRRCLYRSLALRDMIDVLGALMRVLCCLMHCDRLVCLHPFYPALYSRTCICVYLS